MSTRRTIALTLAALATAGGAALAVPAVAGAEPAPAAVASSASSAQTSDAWVITVKRATYPTLQAERDRVMHDAERAGWTATLRCTEAVDDCNDTFVVSGVSYRSVVTRYRYDDAIVSITPAD